MVQDSVHNVFFFYLVREQHNILDLKVQTGTIENRSTPGVSGLVLIGTRWVYPKGESTFARRRLVKRIVGVVDVRELKVEERSGTLKRLFG